MFYRVNFIIKECLLMSLHINGLSKHFEQSGSPPAVVLQDIQLTIHEGQFVSLLGPSGCGKSTLLSIIAGLQKPTTGDLYLGEEKITKPSTDKKSTRLNSSHVASSYAVFCLKKKRSAMDILTSQCWRRPGP